MYKMEIINYLVNLMCFFEKQMGPYVKTLCNLQKVTFRIILKISTINNGNHYWALSLVHHCTKSFTHIIPLKPQTTLTRSEQYPVLQMMRLRPGEVQQCAHDAMWESKVSDVDFSSS